MTTKTLATPSLARPCPACQSDAHFRRGSKGGFDLVTCRRCKTLYVPYLPDEGSQEDYDSYYDEENLTVPEFVNRRLQEIVTEFSRYRQSGRLLDVGFGSGALLKAARENGWQALGVDVSSSATEHVRLLGYEVVCGTLADADYPNDYFDVVTASEVIEHVPDARVFLREVTRVLRPQGLLWLTTPHARGLSGRVLGAKWSVVSPPEHLQLFSRGAIKRMLAASGLRSIRMATEGVNPYELVHGLMGRKPIPDTSDERPGDRRVETGYSLNEALMATPSRRFIKGLANWVLDVGCLGDTLKVWAEKLSNVELPE